MAAGEALMQIPVYRLPFSEADIAFVLEGVEAALRRGYLTDGGEYVRRFEEAFASYVAVGHAVAVNSATTGLEAALRALRVAKRTVIVPSYTFVATPMAVANAGGLPLYADIERETLSLSVRTIEDVVRDDTAGVVIVHVGGIVTPDIDAIRAFCDRRGIFLLEDAACAAGSTVGDRMAGSFAHAAVFSFHHSKVLTTGEGGMVVTNDGTLAERLRRVRAIGLDRALNNWQAHTPGSNFKMHEITAVLGIRQVANAASIVRERQEIARFYDANLADARGVSPFRVPSGTTSSFYKYIVRVTEPAHKAVIRAAMAARGVMLPPNLYDHLCHDQDVNREIGAVNAFAPLPNSEYMRDHHLCLNMFNGLTPDEQRYVVDCFRDVTATL